MWVVAVVLAGIVLAASRQTWRYLGYPVTIVHELGHAVAALSVGFRLRGITVNADMSGATNVWSRGRFRTVWTLWWGYPAPAAVGAGLVWAADSGWARAVLWVLVAGLVLVFLLSRSWLTIGIVLLCGAVLGLTAWHGSDVVVTLVVASLAWLLIIGSVRALWSVARSHIRRSGLSRSDAYLIGRQLRIVPGVVWLLSFAVVIAAAGWYAATAVLAVLT